VFIMFAIVALRFMGGKFYSCNDGAAFTRADCIGSFLANSGVWMPRVWDKPNYNFDGFGKARQHLSAVAKVTVPCSLPRQFSCWGRHLPHVSFLPRSLLHVHIVVIVRLFQDAHYRLGNLPAQAMPSLFELTTVDN